MKKAYSWKKYQDQNVNSPTYGQVKWQRNPEGDAECTKKFEPRYESTGVKKCSSREDSFEESGKGAYRFEQFKDMNELSETYNNTEWRRLSSEDGICQDTIRADWQPTGESKCSMSDTDSEQPLR